MAAQCGPKNPFWKGGMVLASNGYILIRVGTGHHLSDVRGYAYEHRIVAEKKSGRRLNGGEVVHHINGDRKDNRPSNLAIVNGNAEHFVHHRKSGKKLRLPGEENNTISCACGCGETFLRFDDTGRPRKYVSGHNPMYAPVQDAIRKVLENGPSTRSLISSIAKINSPKLVSTTLNKMKNNGTVEMVGNRFWRLKGKA